jgi:hypothetical protein
MTQAQKIAKAKFKQAIAYRTKTGVSLKEAFAHIYGKKKVVKKSVKKAARKKAVKKVAKRRIAGPKDSAMVKRELAKKGLKMPHGYATIKRKRKISGVKKKKITETGILSRIHKVKKDVERLDEAQHKHMMGKISLHNIDKIKSSLQELKKLETHLAILKNVKPKIVKTQLPVIKNEIKNTINSIKEIKTHIRELKKSI